jgi:septum formation protein
MRHVVLASTSRYRRALLERLRIPFEAAPPRYDEREPPGEGAEAIAETHALGKARSLAVAYPESLIIGSDQVVSLEDRILGKPGTRARAIEQLRVLRGREHTLITALVVLDAVTFRVERHLDRTRLRLRDLSDAEIRAYVDADEPLDCAGSYRSESLGIALFEYLRGDDPTAIVGLPLAGLVRLLGALGVNVLLASRDPEHLG